MQITHEEARQLTQFQADGVLDSSETSALNAHLKVCGECRAYADDINEMESILLPIMQRQWNFQPTPLSLNAIITGRHSKKMPASLLLATRTAMIGIAVVVLALSAWQFTVTDKQISSLSPLAILPVPTPSIYSTSTEGILQDCEETRYKVQEKDTLESIARQFMVSKEEIMAANNLKVETVRTTMELMIPGCRSTPTGTLSPPASTTTYTPQMCITPYSHGG